MLEICRVLLWKAMLSGICIPFRSPAMLMLYTSSHWVPSSGASSEVANICHSFFLNSSLSLGEKSVPMKFCFGRMFWLWTFSWKNLGWFILVCFFKKIQLVLGKAQEELSGGPSFWSVIESIGKAHFIDLNQPVRNADFQSKKTVYWSSWWVIHSTWKM